MTHSHPRLRPYASRPVWAQTASEAAAFDRWAIDETGVPQPVLMENAGRSAALVVSALFPGRRAVGVVGAGNNGGDGLVVLRTLAAWGWEVTAVLVADRDPEDPLLHGWPVRVVPDTGLAESDWADFLGGADVVVDAILGTGVRGAPRARQAAAIEAVNACEAPVVALDVPSGVDASDGAVPGTAVRARLTVSFGAPKLGALLHPARAFVGRHVSVEIGFPPLGEGDAAATVATPAWVKDRLPRRDTDTHKNRAGRVLVVGGSSGMAGAAVLAARAAFRAGAGYVRVCSVSANREAIQSAIPEAVYVDADDPPSLAAAVANSDAVVVGPGLGTDGDATGVLRRALDGSAVPVLLDADALNLAAAGALDLAGLGRARPVLLTPHPGEMARLLDEEGEGVASRPASARAAAARFASTVLYKGAPSLVASPDGRLLVDTQSSSDLAVAGMGDTLAGVCGALLAQGLDPATAAAAGLYLSGRAAALAARGTGTTPSDVAERLPDARAEETPAETELAFPFVIFDADAAR